MFRGRLTTTPRPKPSTAVPVSYPTLRHPSCRFDCMSLGDIARSTVWAHIVDTLSQVVQRTGLSTIEYRVSDPGLRQEEPAIMAYIMYSILFVTIAFSTGMNVQADVVRSNHLAMLTSQSSSLLHPRPLDTLRPRAHSRCSLLPQSQQLHI